MAEQNFIDALDNDGINIEENEIQTAEMIDRLIKSAMKILRFIDDKIVIRNYFTETQSGLINQLEYYSINGILVYIDIRDTTEEEIIDSPWGDMDPEPSKHKFKKFGGTCFFLLRTGELVLFQRDGYESLGEFDPSEYEYRLSKPQIITVLQAVKMDSNFEQQFMKNFKDTISTTIKENPNKAPILKNVINYLKIPKDNVLIQLSLALIRKVDELFGILPDNSKMSRDEIEKAIVTFLNDRINDMENAIRSEAEADKFDFG
ncbi:MAG TPA: hypothetical protein VKM55_13815 [Candidatus Lokiarchaeia archaeon]|nr:hypothetical protein [Candidatus Lokiarchaeia archaeon]